MSDSAFNDVIAKVFPGIDPDELPRWMANPLLSRGRNRQDAEELAIATLLRSLDEFEAMWRANPARRSHLTDLEEVAAERLVLARFAAIETQLVLGHRTSPRIRAARVFQRLALWMLRAVRYFAGNISSSLTLQSPDGRPLQSIPRSPMP